MKLLIRLKSTFPIKCREAGQPRSTACCKLAFSPSSSNAEMYLNTTYENKTISLKKKKESGIIYKIMYSFIGIGSLVVMVKWITNIHEVYQECH